MSAPATDARATLGAALNAALLAANDERGPVTVLEFERSAYTTTLPIEVLSCRWPSGSTTQVLCKREPGGADPLSLSHGHRGGVEYEARVYKDVLRFSRSRTARFVGYHCDPKTADKWMFLEYLDGGLSVGKLHSVGAMTSAAEWIGRFHAELQTPTRAEIHRCLHSYDRAYYMGWADRAERNTESLHTIFPWQRSFFRDGMAQVTEALLGQPQTVIHGEFYPHNVLYHEGAVCPIDWESAAIGAGPIDLAALTERWPAQVVDECSEAYCKARWPGGNQPAGFRAALRAARIYLCARWLGRARPLSRSTAIGYSELIESEARELGLLRSDAAD